MKGKKALATGLFDNKPKSRNSYVASGKTDLGNRLRINNQLNGYKNRLKIGRK